MHNTQEAVVVAKIAVPRLVLAATVDTLAAVALVANSLVAATTVIIPATLTADDDGITTMPVPCGLATAPSRCANTVAMAVVAKLLAANPGGPPRAAMIAAPLAVERAVQALAAPVTAVAVCFPDCSVVTPAVVAATVAVATVAAATDVPVVADC